MRLADRVRRMSDEAIVVLAFMSLIPFTLLLFVWVTRERCECHGCKEHGGYCCPSTHVTDSRNLKP